MSGIHMMLLGGSAKLVEIANVTQSAQQTVLTPATASATVEYRLANTGQASYTRVPPGGAVNLPGEWLIAGNAGDYEVRFTLQSGAFAGGTFGSWLDLALTQTILVQATQSTVGTTVQTGTALVEIRRKLTTAIIDSATVQLTATANVEI